MQVRGGQVSPVVEVDGAGVGKAPLSIFGVASNGRECVVPRKGSDGRAGSVARGAERIRLLGGEEGKDGATKVGEEEEEGGKKAQVLVVRACCHHPCVGGDAVGLRNESRFMAAGTGMKGSLRRMLVEGREGTGKRGGLA